MVVSPIWGWLCARDQNPKIALCNALLHYHLQLVLSLSTEGSEQILDLVPKKRSLPNSPYPKHRQTNITKFANSGRLTRYLREAVQTPLY